MKLQCHNLSVSIPEGAERRWLFHHLEAEFAPGLTVVVGPNGAGKTTLMRALAGLSPPAEGDVDLGGRPLLAMSRGERARALAYLPQNTSVSHDLAVHDLVMLGRLPYLPRLGPPSAADQDRVERALEQVGVAALRDRRLSTLSGGERQRVMLARMLATEASVLVLDEPTTSLDIRHSLDVLELCRTLGEEGRTLLVSLHDLPMARRYGTRALCLAGDAAGTVHQGSATDVLRPEILSDVFEVPLELRQGELVLAPRET